MCTGLRKKEIQVDIYMIFSCVFGIIPISIYIKVQYYIITINHLLLVLIELQQT